MNSRSTFPLALLLFTLVALSACGGDSASLDATNTRYARLSEPALPTLDELAITVADTSREVLYTNKVAAYYYGETGGAQRASYQGFNVRGFEFVDSWRYLIDTLSLGPEQMLGGTVHPAYATRAYRFADEPDGFVASLLRLVQDGRDERLDETIFLPDSLNALIITPQRAIPEDVPDSVRTRAFRFAPLFTDGTKAATFQTDVDAASGALLIARTNHMTRRNAQDHPVWLAVWSPEGRAAKDTSFVLVDTTGFEQERYAPATLNMTTAAPIAFATGDTPEEAIALAQRAVRERDALLEQKQARLTRLLDRSYVATQDGRFNRAFAWARLSADALIMSQRGKGIFAGLPWFNQYWGRDTFISMPGMLWATGQWEEAREILLEVARRQNRDRRFGVMGRIPNQITADDVTYNTADGTPWFVKNIWAFYQHTGERSIIQQRLFADAFWASRGSFERADSLRFMRHGEQETWMDASLGPGREWSPRGDRAADIQGLWYEQLLVTGNIASEIVRVPTQAKTEYLDPAEQLKQNFRRVFVNERDSLIYDHLNSDNTPDRRIRPNALFALRSFGFEPELTCAITRRYASELAYPYGVASLTQADTTFRPYHIAPEYYPKDAAYHNGTVWTWLSGPLVSLLTDCGAADLAYEQVDYLNKLVLDRGAVGAIAENQDAIPRDGRREPYLSGTASQAWSMAEYLRNVYQDFAGINYERFDRIVIEPHLPEDWGTTEVKFRVGAQYVTATLQQEADELALTLAAPDSLPATTTFIVRAFGQEKRVPFVTGTLALTLTPDAITVGEQEATADATYEVPSPALWEGFAWQKPNVQLDLPALRPPEEGDAMLSHDIISQKPSGALPIFNATDPPRDDRGASLTYTYPTAPEFKPGILDATLLRIWEDDEHYYFRMGFYDLVQPGWHPEYGFQLTFVALAFNYTADEGNKNVERNANYQLENGYEQILYVGGGFRLENADGRMLAEYRPQRADASAPMGDVNSKVVEFAIPKARMELPNGTRITMLVGAQDDHGGGGLGDFRQVQRGAATENTGGGKLNASQPNVYDVLTGTVRRPN